MLNSTPILIRDAGFKNRTRNIFLRAGAKTLLDIAAKPESYWRGFTGFGNLSANDTFEILHNNGLNYAPEPKETPNP